MGCERRKFLQHCSAIFGVGVKKRGPPGHGWRGAGWGLSCGKAMMGIRRGRARHEDTLEQECGDIL